MPGEVLVLGQHRDGGRAVLGVMFGEIKRIGVFAQHPLGRAGGLELGDDGARPFCFDGVHEGEAFAFVHAGQIAFREVFAEGIKLKLFGFPEFIQHKEFLV